MVSDPSTSSFNSVSSNDRDSKIGSKRLENPRIIVIHGIENTALIADALLQKCNRCFDLYCSKISPSHMIDLHQYRKIDANLKNKNVKIRVITEIDADNLEYCKQIIDLFDVYKTSEGTEVSAIADGSLYITTSPLEDGNLVSELIYSNVKGIINQKQILVRNFMEKGSESGAQD